MDCTCGYNHLEVNVRKRVAKTIPQNASLRLDPTRTTSLRKKMLADVTRRFRLLKTSITDAIVAQDVFSLKDSGHGLIFNVEPKQFAFTRSSDKVDAFMSWLGKQQDEKLLTVSTIPGQLGQAAEQAWTDTYIKSAYQMGITRAGQELRKIGMDVPINAGSLGVSPVVTAFNSPIHADRVGLMYTRTFSELKGITAAMDQQISGVLAQGLIDGKVNAAELAKIINGRVDAVGLARARTLARTEIVRAHHLANIQEYKNAGLTGVKIQAEWMTAGWNVCPVCQPLEGKIYTIAEIEPMIPRHPNCLLDGQIPIYTLEGWKPIVDIKVGDMVLTHKGRFKKVIQLHRNHTEVGQDCVRFGTKNWSGNWTRVSVTANHPIFTDRGWIPASDLNEDDILSVLSSKCKQCGELVPWNRPFCSNSCRSKFNAVVQWEGEVGKKRKASTSIKAREQMLREYESGVRDKFLITKKANEATRENVAAGTHPLQKAENHRRANQKLGRIHKAGGTWIEKKLFWALSKMGLNPVVGFSVLIRNRGQKNRYLFPDFAFPEHKILVEADGIAWHDKEKDDIRDKKLNSRGWDVLHFTEAEIHKNVMECAWQTKRFMLNHSGSFEFLKVPLTRIEKFKTKRRQQTFNLSVEDDESYLAWGWIVHNCRCSAIPYYPGWNDAGNAPSTVLDTPTVEETKYLKSDFKSDNGIDLSLNPISQWKGSGKNINSFEDALVYDVKRKDEFLDLFLDYEKTAAVEKTLQLSEIKTYQTSVYTDQVNLFIDKFDLEEYKKDLPVVFKLPDGTLLLKDGNHRVNAAIINGIKELPFKFFELEKI